MTSLGSWGRWFSDPSRVAGRRTTSRCFEASGWRSKTWRPHATSIERLWNGGAASLSSSEGADVQARKLIALEAIRAARERIAGSAVRTPLVRLAVDDAP